MCSGHPLGNINVLRKMNGLYEKSQFMKSLEITIMVPIKIISEFIVLILSCSLYHLVFRILIASQLNI